MSFTLYDAWEREATSRSAGLRTFPLVSMAACTFTILAMSIFEYSSEVSGTSTAAAIWSTGAIGIAVGLACIKITIALSIMLCATHKVIRRVNKLVG